MVVLVACAQRAVNIPFFGRSGECARCRGRTTRGGANNQRPWDGCSSPSPPASTLSPPPPGRPARAAPDPPPGRAHGDVASRPALVRGLQDKAHPQADRSALPGSGAALRGHPTEACAPARAEGEAPPPLTPRPSPPSPLRRCTPCARPVHALCTRLRPPGGAVNAPCGGARVPQPSGCLTPRSARRSVPASSRGSGRGPGGRPRASPPASRRGRWGRGSASIPRRCGGSG